VQELETGAIVEGAGHGDFFTSGPRPPEREGQWSLTDYPAGTASTIDRADAVGMTRVSRKPAAA